MKYVDLIERHGEVIANFDRYFQYLRSVQPQMPPELYAYASSLEHYSLNGENSLHDAWLTLAGFDYRKKELALEFLGAFHDRKLILNYTGVKTYAFDLSVQFTHGDGDVLAHEFRIEDGLVTHEIAFPSGRTIVVTAKAAIHSIEMLESANSGG